VKRNRKPSSSSRKLIARRFGDQLATYPADPLWDSTESYEYDLVPVRKDIRMLTLSPGGVMPDCRLPILLHDTVDTSGLLFLEG